jgi:hypothetical protein
MPTKLIACLLAACVVAGGGAYLLMDTSSCGTCPLSKLKSMASSGECPSCTAEASLACEGDTSSCCSTSKVAAKASCCSDEPCSSKDTFAAGIGGTVLATK